MVKAILTLLTLGLFLLLTFFILSRNMSADRSAKITKGDVTIELESHRAARPRAEKPDSGITAGDILDFAKELVTFITALVSLVFTIQVYRKPKAARAG